MVPYDPSQRYDVDTFDIEFLRHGADTYLARVYRPRGEGPFPTVVDVHGGQWHLQDRRSNARVDLELAASGVLVVAIDFRLAPGHPYPAAVQDVHYGVRWLKAKAHEYGGRPEPLGVFGGSSGGHLSELVAMRPHDPAFGALELAEAPRLDATVGYLILRAPISDPFARYEFAKRTGRDDIVRATEQFFVPWETIFAANPQRLLARRDFQAQPPMLILQGGADENIDPEIQKTFAETYRAAGGDVELHVFPGMEHQFVQRDSAETTRALELARAFIARQVASVPSGR